MPKANDPAKSQGALSPANPRIALGLILGSILLGGLGWFLWQRWSAPVPPAVNLQGVDPDIAQAIEKARAEVSANPRSAASWGKLGMVLRAHDFGAEANRCFAHAEMRDSEDPRWPYLRALTLILEDPSEAIPHLEKAVANAPHRSAPRLRLAEVLLKQGRAEEAATHFKKVLENDPSNPRACLGLGRLANHRDEAKESLEFLHVAAASPMARKAALTLRAEVRQKLGDFKGAKEDLSQTARLLSDMPWPDPFVEEVERFRVGLASRLALADQWLHQGRDQEAIDFLEETARAFPQSDRVPLQLGQALIQLKDWPGAEKAFRRMIELVPEAAEAHFQLGNALALQGKHRPAAVAYQKAIGFRSGHALAHYNLGLTLLGLDDRAGALASFGQVLRFDPNYAPAHINLGDLLAQVGKKAEAIAHLEEAVRLGTTEDRALKLLAQLKKQIDAAKKLK